MLRKYVALCAMVILITALSISIQGQEGTSVVSAAARAMGAENLKTVHVIGSGSNAGIGQNLTPTTTWPLVKIKTYNRQIDLDAVASNMQAIRIQNNAETTQNQVIQPNAAWNQQYDIWLTPYGFLKGALANPVTMRTEMFNGVRYNIVSFVLQNKYKVEGDINPQTNMVDRVRTWIDNDVFGDMLVEASYMEYKDIGGVKVPGFAIIKQGSFPTLILAVNDAKFNVPVTIPPPAAPAQAAAPGAPAGPTVTTEKIAEGINYLRGGTHHSVLIEFADHLTLIEAPQNEARSLALLAEVKRLYPTKPLTQVVNTHHHFDHSGGLRAFVDAGVTIVTHEINKPFYEKTFAAPRTLNPDRLEQSKKKPTFMTVGDKLDLGDATRKLELHVVTPNNHNSGMLMAFLPNEKILIQADMYTPPAANAPAPAANAPVNPNALALLTSLEKLRLDFETILPLHGPGKVARADLYAFVQKPLVPVSSLPDPNAPPVVAAPDPADAPMIELVNTACTACHNLQRVNEKKGSKAAWTDTVTRMKGRGAAVPDDQLQALSDYLAKVHPE